MVCRGLTLRPSRPGPKQGLSLARRRQASCHYARLALGLWGTTPQRQATPKLQTRRTRKVCPSMKVLIGVRPGELPEMMLVLL